MRSSYLDGLSHFLVLPMSVTDQNKVSTISNDLLYSLMTFISFFDVHTLLIMHTSCRNTHDIALSVHRYMHSLFAHLNPLWG
jgi:hypothetical protein